MSFTEVTYIKEYLLLKCQSLMGSLDAVLEETKSVFGTLGTHSGVKVHVHNQGVRIPDPRSTLQPEISSLLNADELLKKEDG